MKEPRPWKTGAKPLGSHVPPVRVGLSPPPRPGRLCRVPPRPTAWDLGLGLIYSSLPACQSGHTEGNLFLESR